ncbi:unnamed protein product, partial [Adineta ricciae]
METSFSTAKMGSVEEPIPGNSLSSRRQLAKIPRESKLMIRQSPVFEKAATSRLKPKNLKNQKKILHKTITISTSNVRTLKQTGKLHQLIYGCNKNNIDLVAVQEHRWQTSEQTNTAYQTLNDETWRFEYCSATPEGHGGIGLLMNPRMSAFFSSSEKISNRIMAVHFMGNPAITIIITYAPTEDKSDVEKDMFYDDLQRYTHDVPSHNVLILAGDLNARLGSDSHTTNSRAIGQYTYHHSTDDNGNRLVNYCEACNMRSTQTRFPQPQSRSWTWLHPNGKSKAQLDHILINGKWLNSIRNVRAYNTVELNSDHQIVKDKLEQLKQAALSNQIRTTWCLVDEISGKRRHNSASQIKRADGTRINSTAELKNTQAIPPALEGLPINQGLITLEEVEQAVKQLKDGKSPGLDYAITPEVLKYGGQWILNQLCNICNGIYENQQIPKQFNTNIIIPIPKKGDKTLTANYRGISLMSVAAKTYNRILLNRIREPFGSILRIKQA